MNINTDTLPSSPLEDWVNRNDCDLDFTSRLASHSALPANDEALDFSRSMPVCRSSVRTSLKVHIPSEDVRSGLVRDMVPPALTPGNSNASSPSDPDTDLVSVVDGGFVMESQDGVLVRPSRLLPGADLLCPFQVLDCRAVVAEVVDFKNHFFSHFRGHHLPLYATCFLCHLAFFQPPQRNPSVIWNRMLDHMVYGHFRAGEDLGCFQPDIALMRHMWNRGIISDAQLKRCQLVAEPTRFPRSVFPLSGTDPVPQVPMAPAEATPPSPVQAHLNQSVGTHSEAYVVMAGRRTERRQRDSTSLMARVRGNL